MDLCIDELGQTSSEFLNVTYCLNYFKYQREDVWVINFFAESGAKYIQAKNIPESVQIFHLYKRNFIRGT